MWHINSGYVIIDIYNFIKDQFKEEINMDYLLEGVKALFDFSGGGWKALVMFAVGIILIWLAIKKEYEPSLLLPM